MRTTMLIATLVMLTVGLLRAAVPPLPEKAMREGADVIIIGSIVKVAHEDRAIPGDDEFVNRVYTITIQVDQTEKGTATGNEVIATTWQIARRPDGWAGPQGQNLTPTEGLRVRAYLVREAGSEHPKLMEPNGLEKLEPTTKPGR